MKIRGKDVPLEQVRRIPEDWKVNVNEPMEVPGMSEAIVETSLSGASGHEDCGDLLKEGCPSLAEKHHLVLAPFLIDPTSENVVRARVMNPFNEDQFLPEGTAIGYDSRVKYVCDVVADEEDDEGVLNSVDLRRLTGRIEEERNKKE
jgi:hypothetical protein